LKKILKSSPPNVLTVFAYNYPKSLWDGGIDSFKDYNKGVLYQILKKNIFFTQGEICAYCECKVVKSYNQRVEHINDKSNYNSSTKWVHNLHLDWNNLIGVCFGGSSPKNTLYPTPQNLSCDSYKEYKNITHKEFLNPLEIQAFPNLFQFKKRTGGLEANSENCKSVIIPNNIYPTTEELVEKTITNLNLNCDRLMMDRHEIFKEYDREITKARMSGNKNIKTQLAQKWFSQRFPSFFTTRRILLGKYAEQFLKENNYNG